MRLLCWNCGGAGNPATIRELRELMMRFAPTILCIFETQIEGARVEKITISLIRALQLVA